MGNIVPFPKPHTPLSDDDALALLREQGEREATAGVYDDDFGREYPWDDPSTWVDEPKPENPVDDTDEPAQGMNSHALWEEYRDLRNQIDDEGAASPNIKWAWPRLLELEAEIKARLSPSLIDITAPVAMPKGRV